MSVSQGFKLLNDSIRGVRQDRQRHEEREMSLKIDQAKLDYQKNDPANQLARAKALDEMKLVDVDFNFKLAGNTMLQDKNFDRYVRPAIDKMLPDNLKMKEDRQIYFAGTDKRGRIPKWQYKQLVQDAETAIAMSGLNNNKLSMEIDDLSEKVENYKKLSGDMKRVQSTPHARNKLSLEKKIAERDDPAKRSERLMAENMEINRAYKSTLGNRTPNTNLLKALDDMRSANNDELKIMASTGTVKNLKKLTYHMDKGDGTTQVRDLWVSVDEVNSAPGSVSFPGGIHHLKSIKTPGITETETLTSDKELIKLQRQDKTVKSYKDLEQQIAAMTSEVDAAKYMEKMAGSNMSAAKIEQMRTMFAEGKPEILKSMQERLSGLHSKYKRFDWFREGTGEEGTDISKNKDLLKPTKNYPHGNPIGLW